MEGQTTQWLPDVLVRGAWGEHAIINNDFNGGPICAAQSTPMFKFLTTLVTVSKSGFTHQSIASYIRDLAKSWAHKAKVNP